MNGTSLINPSLPTLVQPASWVHSSVLPQTGVNDYAAGTMNALTLVAAATGSPALARLCANPVFAGASLCLGIQHQIQGWNHIDNPLAAELLVLSTLGSFIGVYSFYRGAIAACEALEIGARLAALDRAQQLQEEALASLKDLAAANRSPSTAAILRETGDRVGESLKLTTTAADHWRDIRDEKPRRIESARQSGLAAQGAHPPHDLRRVREKVVKARRAATNAAVQAYRVGRLAPANLSRLAEPPQTVLMQLTQVESLLESATGWEPVGTLGRLGSFRAWSHVRRTVATAAHAFESRRVAHASPLNWVSEARSDDALSSAGKVFWEWFGKVSHIQLLYLLPVLAALQVVTGMDGSLVLHLASAILSCSPAATVYLYNARRGSPRFNVFPTMTQNMGVDVLLSQTVQERGKKRLREAVPRLMPGEEAAYVAGIQKKAAGFEANLDAFFRQLKTLEPFLNAGASPPLPFSEQEILPVRFQPRRPNPARPFRYGRLVRGSADRMKSLRQQVKSMSLEELDRRIQGGDITHEDIFNMIRGHRVSEDGAVIPRPLEGKLERRILKLVRDADRKGEVRRFVMVKDLFPGLDGVLNAGSETLGPDYPQSPLIERLIEGGCIPIPCSRTASAQGGSGLFIGNGAVGNPVDPHFDSAGSSGPEAYVLGLDDFPVRLAIASDTFGSTAAPCGAVCLQGFVPEKDMFSRTNMIPSATYLDTPTVMGVDRREVMELARRLTLPAFRHRFVASGSRPVIAYFSSDDALVSGKRKKYIKGKRRSLEAQGYRVVDLGVRPSDLLWLYEADYAASALSQMGADQENAFGEPPRYILSRNLQNRYAKGLLLLETEDKDHGNLFNRMVTYNQRYADLLRHHLRGVVLLAPAPEAVPLDDFHPGGNAGTQLDTHDLTGASFKNTSGAAMYIDGASGYVLEGATSDLMRVWEG